MNPKVTVITCVYNGLPYLEEAIDSVLNQSYKNFEYLIIDDASPDIDVLKLIESYDDSRIRLIKNETNIGVSRTFNKALGLVKTPYVVRLDQDDVNLPGRIEKQINFLENNENIDIVCSWEYAIDSNGKIIGTWQRSLKDYGSFLGYIFIGICPIWHPSIAFKAKSLIDAGGFKTQYTRAEDFEVTARLALSRCNAFILPEFHLLQRQHTGSQSSEFNQLQEDVTHQIHQETIEKFTTHKDIELLRNFLILQKGSKKVKLTKANIFKIKIVLDEFLTNVIQKQKLTDNELNSLKKILYRRVGYGVKYFSFLAKLPTIFFYPAFFALSPLQIASIRLTLSKIYYGLIKAFLLLGYTQSSKPSKYIVNDFDALKISTKPRVTILMTVFNGSKFLNEAIDSVLCQTLYDFEFIIVDDYSSDGSVKLIESYSDLRIKLIKNKKNIGQAACLNNGIALSKSDLIARIDQDDVCLPRRLEEQSAYLIKNPSVSVVCSNEYIINSESIVVGSWKRKLTNYGSFLSYILVGISPLWTPSVMFVKNDILELDGYDENLGPASDLGLWSKIALKRLNAHILSEFHLLQRQHEESQSNVFNELQENFSHQIHKNVVNNFTAHEDVDLLSNFLILEKGSHKVKLTKANIIRIKTVLDDFLINVIQQQKLTDVELNSLKKILFRRVGFGVKYSSFLVKLPSIFFYPLYYFFSPFQSRKFRSFSSLVYGNFSKFIFIFKNIRIKKIKL